MHDFAVFRFAFFISVSGVLAVRKPCKDNFLIVFRSVLEYRSNVDGTSVSLGNSKLHMNNNYTMPLRELQKKSNAVVLHIISTWPLFWPAAPEPVDGS
jgi:hypothetical protein